jgi:hypothetical protein
MLGSLLSFRGEAKNLFFKMWDLKSEIPNEVRIWNFKVE